MKYFLSIFFLSFYLNNASAQEKHFVFIQSDTRQPFYVSLNGKLFSSTASGYLIIPKLSDGTYNFTVGFAQNTFPEQAFSCAIQNNDLGFELKNMNDKGWALFNLQTLNLTMASTANTNVVAKALSENSGVKVPPPVISFEKKKDTAVVAAKPSVEALARDVTKPDAVTKQDSMAVGSSKTSSETLVKPSEPIKTTTGVLEKEKTNEVRKVSQETRDEGVHISYVEGSGKIRDTINVIIPSSPVVSTAADNKASTTTNSSNNSGNVASRPAEWSKTPKDKDDIKFLDINMGSKKDSGQLVEAPKESRKIMENSNCKNIATDDDYVKLRKKMASETTDEKMISEAKKYYRNKCFTTSQIKRLSSLFLSDEGRFKFFDASFVSVSDVEQYPTLQTEFIDPAFVSRFKSLLQ